MTSSIPFPEVEPPRWQSDRRRNWRLRWRTEVAGLSESAPDLDPEALKSAGRFRPTEVASCQAGILTLPGLPPLFHRRSTKERHLRLLGQPLPLRLVDLAQQLRSFGIRTPAPLALRYSTGPLYRYDLYFEALLGGRNGDTLWQTLDETALAIVMDSAGRVLAQVHRAGFDLPDLKLDHLLFRGGIDGALETWIVGLEAIRPSRSSQGKSSTLSGLRTTLLEGEEHSAAARERLWEALRTGYHEEGGGTDNGA